MIVEFVDCRLNLAVERVESALAGFYASATDVLAVRLSVHEIRTGTRRSVDIDQVFDPLLAVDLIDIRTVLNND